MDAVKENMQLICCGDLMSVRRHQTLSNYLDRKDILDTRVTECLKYLCQANCVQCWMIFLFFLEPIESKFARLMLSQDVSA